MQNKTSRVLLLKALLYSPFFLALLAISSIAYYYLIHYVILFSNNGAYILTLPLYLLYGLVFTSALLLAIGLYSMRLSILKPKYTISEDFLSIGTAFIGSLVTSCGCSEPLLASILYALGANIFGVTSAISFVSSYQNILVGIVIVVNLSLIYYYLGRTSKSCSIKNNKIKVR